MAEKNHSEAGQYIRQVRIHIDKIINAKLEIEDMLDEDDASYDLDSLGERDNRLDDVLKEYEYALNTLTIIHQLLEDGIDPFFIQEKMLVSPTTHLEGGGYCDDFAVQLGGGWLENYKLRKDVGFPQILKKFKKNGKNSMRLARQKLRRLGQSGAPYKKKTISAL